MVTPLTLPSSLLEFVASEELGGGAHLGAILLLAWLAGTYGLFSAATPLFFGCLAAFCYWHSATLRVRSRLTWNSAFAEREPAAARRLLGHQLPPWVCLSSVERSRWVQLLVDRLWPHIRVAGNASIEAAISDLVREKVTPIVAPFLESLMLSHFDVGAVPITVDGVEVHRSVGATSIDLHVFWAGDASVVFRALPRVPAVASKSSLSGGHQSGPHSHAHAHAAGGGGSASGSSTNRRVHYSSSANDHSSSSGSGRRNSSSGFSQWAASAAKTALFRARRPIHVRATHIQFRGIVRLTLGPHCHAWCCARAVGVSFVGSPLIDFKLTIGALALDALPGAPSMVERLVGTFVSEELVYPNAMRFSIDGSDADGASGKGKGGKGKGKKGKAGGGNQSSDASFPSSSPSAAPTTSASKPAAPADDPALEPIGCSFVTILGATGLPMSDHGVLQALGFEALSYVRATYSNGDPNRRVAYRTRAAGGDNPSYDDGDAAKAAAAANAAGGSGGGGSASDAERKRERKKRSRLRSASSASHATTSAVSGVSAMAAGRRITTTSGLSSSPSSPTLAALSDAALAAGSLAPPLADGDGVDAGALVSRSARMQFPFYGLSGEAVRLEVRKVRTMGAKVVTAGLAAPDTVIGYVDLSSIDLQMTATHRLPLLAVVDRRGVGGIGEANVEAVTALLSRDGDRPFVHVRTEYRRFRRTEIASSGAGGGGGGSSSIAASAAFGGGNGAAPLISSARRRQQQQQQGLAASATSAFFGMTGSASSSFAGTSSDAAAASAAAALTPSQLFYSNSLSSPSFGLSSRGGGAGSLLGGLLMVHVVRGDGLLAADLDGLSDPFVTLRIGRSVAATQIIFGSLSPKWDRTVYLNVESAARDVLEVSVFDYDRFSANDFLGRLRIGVVDVVTEGGECAPRPYPLEGQGTVTLGLKLLQFEATNE